MKKKDIVGGDCIKDSSGQIVVDGSDIKQISKHYYDKLLYEEFDWNRDLLDTACPVEGPSEQFSISEVSAAISKAKCCKAAGPSGVVSDMVLAAGVLGVEWVTDI